MFRSERHCARAAFLVIPFDISYKLHNANERIKLHCRAMATFNTDEFMYATTRKLINVSHVSEGALNLPREDTLFFFFFYLSFFITRENWNKFCDPESV